MADAPRFVPYRPPRLPLDEARARGEAFYVELDGRRSVRAFSPDPVPRELIELAIRSASTSPSGAHQQPWTFVAISETGRQTSLHPAHPHGRGGGRC